MDNDKKDIRSRSWFITLNNPEDHGFSGTPEEMCQQAIDLWVGDSPTRTCMVSYNISAEKKTPHFHMVCEDTKIMRFSSVQKLFNFVPHIEVTQGSKKQAENYISKEGFEAKGEQVLSQAKHGEIKANQGKRSDLDEIQDLIDQGYSWRYIVNQNIRFRRYESIIKAHCFDKKVLEIGSERDIKVYWHVGKSGSGKSYEYINLLRAHPDDVYRVVDYQAPFDGYAGESIIFFDEFRGHIPFTLLLVLLDPYTGDVHCRYYNSKMLWSEVHFASINPPDEIYAKYLSECDNPRETFDELARRSTAIIYHWYDNSKPELDEKEKHRAVMLPFEKYTNYDDLKALATSDSNGFSPVPVDSLPDAFRQSEVEEYIDVSNYSGIEFK